MSFIRVPPDIVVNAAGELERLGSTLSVANSAAAAATTGVAAPAADEVSAAIAALLNTQAQEYQSLSAQAATFHSQFVTLLNVGAGSYISTEIANTRAAAASGGIVQSFGDGLLSTLVGAESEFIDLPLDAVGPVITATTALGQSGTAFVDAVMAGNPGAAMAVLRNAAPTVASAFLYGQNTVSVPLPSDISGVSLALNIPFGGVLAAVQPITATATFDGFDGDLPPFTIPFPMEVGGIIPEVQANGPAVALALLLLPILLAGSLLGG
jgi:PE family